MVAYPAVFDGIDHIEMRLGVAYVSVERQATAQFDLTFFRHRFPHLRGAGIVVVPGCRSIAIIRGCLPTRIILLYILSIISFQRSGNATFLHLKHCPE